MDKIKEHKDYVIGITITALIGAIASSFGPQSVDLPIYINLPLTILTVILMCSLIAVIILALSWIFTKNFTFTRFIKITTVVCFLWTLSSILSTIKNMN
jgi:hypothetical protein